PAGVPRLRARQRPPRGPHLRRLLLLRPREDHGRTAPLHGRRLQAHRHPQRARMKRTLVVIVVIALAALAVWIVATGQDAPPDGAPIPVDDGAGLQAAPGSHQMTVDEIIDGDTLTLTTDTVQNGFPPEPRLRVRLVGIDTPEVYPEY